MTKAKLSPRALDWICNGVPVYIRRRPLTGEVYATLHDFSKFIHEPPLEVMRLRVGDLADIRTWEPEKDARVMAAMHKHRISHAARV
jgi:hypothetical protein